MRQGGERRRGGFTLIELAMVITIMGILLASFLQFYEIQLERTRIETTRKRLENLRAALTTYVATNDKLPCPGSPVPPPPGKADDQAPANACTEGKQEERGENDQHKPGGQDEIVTGVIPVRDLRLSQGQATDGWGNLFTYVVTKKLTLENGMRGNPPPPGVLNVIDADGHNILDTPSTGRFVIISHGHSAKGAWVASGAQRPCDIDALDGENCNGDATFVVASFSLHPGKNFYDDIVIHDDVNVRGTLLDRLVACNTRKAFYEPADATADSDGCAKEQGLWQGACLLSYTIDSSGAQKPTGPPNAVLSPATASGASCGCDSTHKVQKIAAWDDGTVQQVVPAQSGSGVQQQTVAKHTALYVCVY